MENLWVTILLAVVTCIVTLLFSVSYKYLRRLCRRYHWVTFLHSAEEVNEKIANMEFLNFERGEQLDGTQLCELYGDDMRSMKIHDAHGERTIRIPYLEMINFINDADTKISIEPLTITKEFNLPEDLKKATEPARADVCRRKKNTHDDPHPRMASFEKINDKEYKCSFEKTCYYNQIRTNLTMDYPIEVPGYGDTTMRKIEMKKRKKDGDQSRRLPLLSESGLANVVGVSAIWCMGDDAAHRKYYLLPRKEDVGVYENMLGMPSGDIECPKGDKFPNDSLVDFLKWEIAREFAEETGIADSERDDTKYSKPLETNKIKHRTKLNIIPLAFLREMLRGGKPQMFFLIRTEVIPDKKLRRCFRASLGVEEFNSKPYSDAKLSTEVACNYLYAQAYLQHCDIENGCIDVSRVDVKK